MSAAKLRICKPLDILVKWELHSSGDVYFVSAVLFVRRSSMYIETFSFETFAASDGRVRTRHSFSDLHAQLPPLLCIPRQSSPSSWLCRATTLLQAVEIIRVLDRRRCFRRTGKAGSHRRGGDREDAPRGTQARRSGAAGGLHQRVDFPFLGIFLPPTTAVHYQSPSSKGRGACCTAICNFVRLV